jgi:predicted aldo/keto reductase-like oxidoreductase
VITLRYKRLGRTGIAASAIGFGALPIQRIGREEAAALVEAAVKGGVNIFDTAHAYGDSEEKLGAALPACRRDVHIVTKSLARSREGLISECGQSLERLKTAYIDVMMIHFATETPDFGDRDGAYAGLKYLQEQGVVRFVGISTHRRELACALIESKRFDVIQFPISYLSDEKDLGVIQLARDKDIGILGMKPMAGGLLSDGRAAAAFMNRYENLVPLWGIQTMEELRQFLDSQDVLPDEQTRRIIKADRERLSGEFCRGCGYCMPCPQGIDIVYCGRMEFMLRKEKPGELLTDFWRERMARIPECTGCGSCRSKCPYELDMSVILPRQMREYEAFLAREAGGP